jgi:predicted deacylase
VELAIKGGWLEGVSSVGAYADIDLDRDGRDWGSLHVEVPSAAGRTVAKVPILRLRNGEGPSAVVFGGTHGDEIDGQVSALRIAEDIRPEELRGTLFILPALNVLAARQSIRRDPVDDLDLNRCFPGAADGAYAERLACYIEKVLLDRCTVAIDLHSGGVNSHFLPSLWILTGCSEELWQRTLRLANAFAPRIIAVSESLNGDMSEAAARADCVYLSTESGGGATVAPEIVTQNLVGVRRVLAEIGLLASAPQELATPDPRLMQVSPEGLVPSPDDGMFEPAVGLGATIEPGQVLGHIHRPWSPEAAATEVRAGTSGLVYGIRLRALVERGERVVFIASPSQALS